MGVVGLLLGVVLIISGIFLARDRKTGRKWSNFYAWASIISKIVMVIWYVLLTYQLMPDYMKAVGLSSLGSSGSEVETMVEMMTHFSAIGTAVFYLLLCLYPILALVFLNKKSVLRYFEEK